jgi:hypothetical protein
LFQTTGHLYVAQLVYDLLAATDDERQRAKALHLVNVQAAGFLGLVLKFAALSVLFVVQNLVDYIMANNLTLVDFNGKRTTWGYW